MEWINVEDQLPEFGEPVIVYMQGLKNFSAHMALPEYAAFRDYEPAILVMARKLKAGSQTKFGWDYPNKGNYVEDRLITHWMPLPEAPK